MPTREPTRKKFEEDAAIERARREENLDRDLTDINTKLQRIEKSIQNIDARETIQVQMQFQLAAVERRVVDLESAKSGVIKLVMGTVGVALLALVVGKVLP